MPPSEGGATGDLRKGQTEREGRKNLTGPVDRDTAGNAAEGEAAAPEMVRPPETLSRSVSEISLVSTWGVKLRMNCASLHGFGYLNGAGQFQL